MNEYWTSAFKWWFWVYVQRIGAVYAPELSEVDRCGLVWQWYDAKDPCLTWRDRGVLAAMLKHFGWPTGRTPAPWISESVARTRWPRE